MERTWGETLEREREKPSAFPCFVVGKREQAEECKRDELFPRITKRKTRTCWWAVKGAITLESVSSDSIEDKGTRRVEMKCKECRKVNTYLLTYLLSNFLLIRWKKKKKKKGKKPNGTDASEVFLYEFVSRGAKIYIAYTNRNHFLTSITTSILGLPNDVLFRIFDIMLHALHCLRAMRYEAIMIRKCWKEF